MNETVANLFTQNLSDTEDLLELLQQLNFVKNNLYSGAQGFITQKMQGFLTAPIERLFAQIEGLNLEPTDDAGQKLFLEGVITYLKSLPVVRITLAFTPTLEFTKKINEVVSSLAKRKVILDMTVDHRIIAGCLIDYQGKFGNYSEQQRIAAILKTKLNYHEEIGVGE